jgi:hypothetical protein
MFSVC